MISPGTMKAPYSIPSGRQAQGADARRGRPGLDRGEEARADAAPGAESAQGQHLRMRASELEHHKPLAATATGRHQRLLPAEIVEPPEAHHHRPADRCRLARDPDRIPAIGLTDFDNAVFHGHPRRGMAPKDGATCLQGRARLPRRLA
jgi:hypothetical protein